MRRGGKNYYALDISSPDKPKQLWSKPIVGGSDGFEYLAQTWSKPQIAYIKRLEMSLYWYLVADTIQTKTTRFVARMNQAREFTLLRLKLAKEYGR